MHRNILTFAIVFVSVSLGLHHFFPKTEVVIQPPPPVVIVQPTPPEPTKPKTYEISIQSVDEYLDLPEILTIVQNWNKEAPEITELGVVGQTSQGTKIPYLRIGTPGKPKVVIHACLHGNERIAASCTLTIMGHFLADYGRNEEVTWLVENRDVFWIPVLSVDSYVDNERHVEGVDPNRNYPCPENPNIKSSSPVQAIMKFCLEHKPKGVISGHSFGRIYLYPRLGDKDKHQALTEKMAAFSNYDTGAIGSGYPTKSSGNRGFEIDWYYWGAKAVSVLTEFGTGSHRMNESLLVPEAEKNYHGYLLFIKECAEMEVNPPAFTVKKQERRRENHPLQVSPSWPSHRSRPRRFIIR